MKKNLLSFGLGFFFLLSSNAQVQDVKLNQSGLFTNVFGELFSGTVTFYYGNGATESIYEVNDGLKDGQMTVYSISGQVKESGSFNLGQKSGEWKTFSDNGKLESIAFYHNDQKHGHWQVWDS